MALCSECKRWISDTATSCPSCGQPALGIVSGKQKNRQWNTLRVIKLSFPTLNWIFGIFFLIGGLGSLSESLLVGVCAVIISLLLLPPVRKYVYSKTNKKIPIAARVISILILLTVAGGLIESSEEEKTLQDDGGKKEFARKLQQNADKFNAKAEKSLTKKKSDTFKQGDNVRVGNISYKVIKTWWATRLFNDNTQKPDAMFLMVRLSVRNKSVKPITIPQFSLIDQLGREYETSSKGWYLDGTITSLDSLNPNVEKNGGVIFDVPKGNDYKLKVSGESWLGEKAFIELSPKDKR